MKQKLILLFLIVLIVGYSCGNGDESNPPQPPPSSFNFTGLTVNGVNNGFSYMGVNTRPIVKLSFSKPIAQNTATQGILFKDAAGNDVPYTIAFENSNSILSIQPSMNLSYLTKYAVAATKNLTAEDQGKLLTPVVVELLTAYDSNDKFPAITDDELLTLVQKQTFKYFWDFAHPTSGLARERNTSGDLVTIGGSGFGAMSIVVGVQRNFISRQEALTRLTKMVDFLTTSGQKFHGAFPHWMNGNTGSVIPFSNKDDGADLVETSLLMQGLLVARQYFDGNSVEETALRNKINVLWNGVEWSWFRKNNENVLYWHWSPNYGWDMNMKIKGWNECLITYVLAASSPTYSVPKVAYDEGWASNGSMKNGTSYYQIPLPLGPAYGGPLFFAHYSFLGLDPNGLKDAYADYQTQVVNHTKINYQYCVTNPLNNYGYGSSCWGLTASDIPNGYTASSPTNDVGVIAPTAAVSSLPYTPTESMAALHFFYYKLGDKLWGNYGFYDSFSLKQAWFSNSYLAIDQGPMIVMIENYRSKLIWNLLMSCPEVKTGLVNLGFQSPKL